MHEIDEMLALQLEGKHAEARALSDKLEAIGPDHIKDAEGNVTQDIWFRHSFNRGWFLLQDGDYQAGCQQLEFGRYLNVYGSSPIVTTAPIFNPNEHDIVGKSILISLEGGFGDEIIHARFATSFKKLGAAKVYIASAPELISVFSRIDGVDGVIRRDQISTVQHDFWVPGFSAGWVSGNTFETMQSTPYLAPQLASVELWNSFISSDKIKVGIRWAGNPKFEHQQFRKFPEEFLTNLSKYQELQIYSLQRDHNTVELPENVIDLQHLLISWEDTMAAIANLDIVITSCTSVAHLSAAMGKETWIMIPVLPYHTWTFNAPANNTTPYYDSVRLFRQTIPRKWNDTFQSMYAQLEEKFNLEHIDMPNEDKVYKKINLGSGLTKLDGFVNIDVSTLGNPDIVMDLNKLPWNFNDNEVDHIVAKDILEHLGDTPAHFIDIIKEMYRVSTNGAIWEIQFPHWRSDIAITDPTHKRSITLQMFELFNKSTSLQRIKNNLSDSLLAFEHDIDLQLCDYNFQYTESWQNKIDEKLITPEELQYALNTFNNVAMSVRVLVQVHKPGRIDLTELTDFINAK